MDSTTELAQLPKDLIVEILVRLPVKSAARSKLVCKTWHHLLKSPSFISMHQKLNSRRLNFQLLICSADGDKYMNNRVFAFRSNDESASVLSPDVPILADPNVFVILARGSCYGIVCYYGYDGLDAVFLSNPATKQFKRLPPTSFHHLGPHPRNVDRTGLAFGGFEAANMYDFKVLRVFSDHTAKGASLPTHNLFLAEIFTFSSNTWKQLPWGLDDSVHFFGCPGLFCANSFHFIVRRYKSSRRAIACCDIHTERFRIMEFPSSARGGFFNSLLVFKGFLSAMYTFPSFKREPRSADIWIMQDYGVVESWTKLYSIKHPWRVASPRCFWTVKDALLLASEENKLLSHRLDTQSSESIEIHGGYNLHSQLLVHQETLVSIM